MKPPGDRIRGLCARVFSKRTLERVIDPTLSDLRREFAEARARGAMWRSRMILLAGYVTLLRVVFVCGCERAWAACRDWTPDDHRALTRTIAISLASIIAVTFLILLPPLRTMPARLAIYLIPQPVPIAIPLGVTVGIFCGLGGGRAISLRLRAAVLGLALASAVLSFATMAWLAPAAGQAFRDAAWKGRGPSRSAFELTMTELRARIVCVLQHVIQAHIERVFGAPWQLLRRHPHRRLSWMASVFAHRHAPSVGPRRLDSVRVFQRWSARRPCLTSRGGG